MFYRILATLTLSFVFYMGSSQISYHRLYETSLTDPVTMVDTIFYHMSSATLSGDVYAIGTKRVGDPSDTINDLSIIFTKHSDKGNVTWTKELDLGRDSVEIKSICDFEFNGTQDSILFAIDIEINDERKEIFGRLAENGNDISLQTVGGYSVFQSVTLPHVVSFVNQSDLLLTPAAQPIISRIGLGDDLMWSRAYTFVNSEGDTTFNYFTDINSTPDTTIVATGIGLDFGKSFVVTELDSNGVQLWAESYTFPINNLQSITPVEVKPLDNGNFAVAGSYTLTGSFENNGFIAIVDSSGTVVMSKKIVVAGNSAGILNLLQADDGTLWMSGIGAVNDTSTYFTVNMDLSGLINWTTIYPGQEPGLSTFSTSLLPVQSTGGATFVGHGFKDNQAVMQVMKHDVDGTTPCSDTIPAIAEDLMITADTLISQVKNGGIFFDTIAFEFNSFNGFFTPPVLSITEYPPFCPNDVIDTLLVASVSDVSDENISYLWSTGEFTDTIRVTEEGQYSVTVTIVEDVCYTMCDTVELTRLTLPQIAITIDNSQFCEEKIIILSGNYTPGAEIQTFLWNTGETTPSINITEPGVYSITVTDECGEIAMDDTDVSLPVFDPRVFFNFNIEEFCETGVAALTAAYLGGGNQPVYTWSDGQMGEEITVSIGGEYSVTVTDECDFTATATEEVMLPAIATEAEITLTPNCDENNPMASTFIVEATGNGEIQLLTYIVNDDGAQTNISTSNPSNSLNVANVDSFLNFIVYARDICGNDLDSLAINGTAICGGLLRYPIAFFPNGQDDIESQTFGPIPSDTMDISRITDVDFKVFNRWGETVFESTEILDAWDGSHKGDPAPSEVYIWYVSYILDGRQMIDKGDITLIR
jgi:gliding motility-associated-like protein